MSPVHHATMVARSPSEDTAKVATSAVNDEITVAIGPVNESRKVSDATPIDSVLVAHEAKVVKSLSRILSGRLTVNPVCTAAPQVVSGHPFWAERWGLTRQQCSELLRRLRADPAWRPENDVYTLVQEYIKKWTAGTGVGYALLVNGMSPKEVNLMVSHAWSENAEEFLETVVRSCSEYDVVFICALSLYQCEDGEGPSISDQIGMELEESPFARVLQNIRATGDHFGWRWRWKSVVVSIPLMCLLVAALLLLLPVIFNGCVPSFDACYYRIGHEKDSSHVFWQRYPVSGTHWFEPEFEDYPLRQLHIPHFTHKCVAAVELESARSSMKAVPRWISLVVPSAVFFFICSLGSAVAVWSMETYDGRMIAVPNSTDDLYSRLWCVYEIFVARCIGVPVHLAHTFASAGTCSSRYARCSSEVDQKRIRDEIEAEGRGDIGYAMIDRAITLVTRSTRWSVLFLILRDGLMVVAVCVAHSAQYSTTPSCEFMYMRVPVGLHPYATGVGQLASLLLIIAILYRIVRVSQGYPGRRVLWKLVFGVYFFVFAVFLLLVVDVLPSLVVSVTHGMVTSSASHATMLGDVLLHASVPCERCRVFLVLANVAAGICMLLATFRAVADAGAGSGSAYPEAVSQVLFTLKFVLPVFCAWNFGVQWGIKLGLRHEK